MLSCNLFDQRKVILLRGRSSSCRSGTFLCQYWPEGLEIKRLLILRYSCPLKCTCEGCFCCVRDWFPSGSEVASAWVAYLLVWKPFACSLLTRRNDYVGRSTRKWSPFLFIVYTETQLLTHHEILQYCCVLHEVTAS